MSDSPFKEILHVEYLPGLEEEGEGEICWRDISPFPPPPPPPHPLYDKLCGYQFDSPVVDRHSNRLVTHEAWPRQPTSLFPAKHSLGTQTGWFPMKHGLGNQLLCSQQSMA